MIQNDTICALATATGGALGIIRISGPNALSVASSICRDDIATKPANTVHYAHIAAGGIIIDEAMVSVFRAPHSYTGEDSVEISCHGSRYILNKVLELLIEHGCRMANPGEYTLRAYLNGKMDLSQAEAVADLIASTNRATHQMAMSQLKGNFSNELARLREQLLHLTSLLELELDFSDHEELEFADRKELLGLSKKVDERIQQLAKSFKTGQAIKKGIPVAIIGSTNVGKSTLLNRLLHDDKAIVSDIHGTTRDVIEDTTEIHGVTFRFIDTAGIRETKDKIERLGIERSYKKLQEAAIVIWLTDKRPSDCEIEKMQDLTNGKHLIAVQNKADQLTPTEQIPWMCPTLFISAKNGIHIEELEQQIYIAAEIPEIKENDIIITNTRHYEALLHAHDSIQHVIDGLQSSISADLLSEDLRTTLSHLSEILGSEITTNEVLGNIFKHFCVGK